jgi:gas vesicle protein
MSKGKFALGALIGTAAGVVAGLLTAPRSGKETRADIKGKAAELKQKAVKQAGEVRQRSDDIVENVKGKVE